MKRLLILLFVLNYFLVLFSQNSSSSTTEKISDNTSQTNTIASSETFTNKVGNYWIEKTEDIVYNVFHLKDGTTKIEDNSGNWMLYKTEYAINEFTGEKSNKPIEGRKVVVTKDFKPKLLAAMRVFPNGYTFEVSRDTISLRTPLNLKFCVKKEVTSDIWLKWETTTDFNSLFAQFTESNVAVYGPKGNLLANLSKWVFKDAMNKDVPGGFYDELTNKMYYVASLEKSIPSFYKYAGNEGYTVELFSATKDVKEILFKVLNEKYNPLVNKMYALINEYQNVENKINQRNYKSPNERSTAITAEQNRIKEEYKKLDAERVYVDNVIVVYCLPSDNISNVNVTDKVVELYFKNGDYLKYSKLMRGQVYDCMMHRPNGTWKVKLDADNNPVSEYVFTSGIYKGLIYKDKIDKSDYAECLSFNEMLHYSMFTRSIIDGYLSYIKRLYDPSNNRWLTVIDKGEIKEYIEEEQARRNAIAKAERDKKESAIYDAYCKKYGKNNIDNIFNARLNVGMPFSAIKDLCVTELTDQMGNTNWYRVFYAGSRYDYDNMKIVPQDVRYVPKAILSYWIVRVSNGVVRSAHKMRVY